MLHRLYRSAFALNETIRPDATDQSEQRFVPLRRKEQKTESLG